MGGMDDWIAADVHLHVLRSSGGNLCCLCMAGLRDECPADLLLPAQQHAAEPQHGMLCSASNRRTGAAELAVHRRRFAM